MARRRRRRAAPRRAILATLAILLIASGAYALYVFGKSRPQDLPWTDLDLAQPVGLFTGRKLVGLRYEPRACRLLLDRAGVVVEPRAPIGTGKCAFNDGVRLLEAGARMTPYRPVSPPVACPVAAALALWEWHVLQPAARRHMKTNVASIEQLGTYNCRRMYGREDGMWSEHSTANAIDISGFTFGDGRRITLIGDWSATGPDAAAKRAFLREVRDGACDVFSTVLSPDYNDAHRDHFHLDQADRTMGRRSCR